MPDDGFVEIASHSDASTGARRGTSTYQFERGPDGQVRFHKRWGCGGVGSVHTHWEGSASDLSDACQKAVEGQVGDSSTCKLQLSGCTKDVYDNDEGASPPETLDCDFILPREFVGSILDKITPPPA